MSVDDELKWLAKLAGMHTNKDVMALVNSPILPRDKKAKLAKFLSGHAARHSPIPHPFLPGPTREEAEAGIAEVGSVVTGKGPEFPFRFREEHFLCHLLSAGSTGAGKSTVLFHLGIQVHRSAIPVWFFDTESDLAAYAVAAAPDILLASYRDVRMALFEGPEAQDLSWQEHLAKLLATFGWSVLAGDAMCNMARETCIALRERQGPFTLIDFYEALLRLKYKVNSREFNFWESLRNRFGGFIVPLLGETFGSPGSHDIRALMGKSVVWDLHALSPDMVNFFMTVLLLWVHLVSPVRSSPRLRLLLVLDEFGRVSGRQQAERWGMGEPLLFDFMRTCRKREIGVLIGTQTPQLLPRQVLSLTNSYVVMRPPDGNFLECVSDALNLDREQEAALMSLPDRNPRQAVVKCPGFSQPFIVQIPEL